MEGEWIFKLEDIEGGNVTCEKGIFGLKGRVSLLLTARMTLVQ